MYGIFNQYSKLVSVPLQSEDKANRHLVDMQKFYNESMRNPYFVDKVIKAGNKESRDSNGRQEYTIREANRELLKYALIVKDGHIAEIK